MARRLSKEEVATIRVLAETGQNHCEIARTLGATEGAVRYLSGAGARCTLAGRRG